jgi:hypothetical protein
MHTTCNAVRSCYNDDDGDDDGDTDNDGDNGDEDDDVYLNLFNMEKGFYNLLCLVIVIRYKHSWIIWISVSDMKAWVSDSLIDQWNMTIEKTAISAKISKYNAIKWRHF